LNSLFVMQIGTGRVPLNSKKNCLVMVKFHPSTDQHHFSN
jgi:hypothetical protein